MTTNTRRSSTQESVHRRKAILGILMAASLGAGGCGANLSDGPAGNSGAQGLDDGTQQAKCLALAQEYAAAQGDAKLCVPTDTCDALRPTTVYLVEGTKKTLEGLSSCTAIYNRSRAGKLDEILARFEAAGCVIGNSPCHPPIVFSEANPPPPCKMGEGDLGRCD